MPIYIIYFDIVIGLRIYGGGGGGVMHVDVVISKNDRRRWRAYNILLYIRLMMCTVEEDGRDEIIDTVSRRAGQQTTPEQN